jgi:hypothetical protein
LKKWSVTTLIFSASPEQSREKAGPVMGSGSREKRRQSGNHTENAWSLPAICLGGHPRFSTASAAEEDPA